MARLLGESARWQLLGRREKAKQLAAMRPYFEQSGSAASIAIAALFSVFKTILQGALRAARQSASKTAIESPYNLYYIAVKYFSIS